MKVNVHGEVTWVVPSTRIEIECKNFKPVARKCGIDKTKHKPKRQERRGESTEKAEQTNFLKNEDRR